MIIFHIIWSFVLAGMLSWFFHGAWESEHGGNQDYSSSEDSPKGKLTSVWFTPTYLIWMLLTVVVCCILTKGFRGGLATFFDLLIEIIFIFSIYFMVLVPVMPYLKKHYSARACAILWLVPVFVFYNVYVLIHLTKMPRLIIYIPKKILIVLFFLWFAGFLFFFARDFIKNLNFSKRINASVTEIDSEEIINLWEETRANLNYHYPVKLCKSAIVKGPFSMGTSNSNRKTVLPDRHYSQQELVMIFSHELHHLQRQDVETKIFLSFVRALCWFNPITWIAVKEAAKDLELSCDEIVVEGFTPEERKAYARLLLTQASPQAGYTTCLSASAKSLQYRLKNTVTERKTKTGALLLGIALFLCCMCYGFIGIADERVNVNELIFLDGNVSVGVTANASDSIDKIEYCYNNEALQEALKNLQAEHIMSEKRDYVVNDTYPSFSFHLKNTDRYGSLYKDVMVLYEYGTDNKEYYKIKGNIDWEAIEATMTFLDYPDLSVYDQGNECEVYFTEREFLITDKASDEPISRNVSYDPVESYEISPDHTLVVTTALSGIETTISLKGTDKAGNVIGESNYSVTEGEEILPIWEGATDYTLEIRYETEPHSYYGKYEYQLNMGE